MREQGLRGSAESDDSLDLEDMRQLRAGHDAALNDLIGRHGKRLFGYLMRSLQNEDDAADAAQETFVRVYQNRVRFDERQRFSTWLYAIASNLVKDRFRWRTRHPQVSMDAEAGEAETSIREILPDEKPVPSEAAENNDRAEKIRRAVGRLPEELRTPLILSEYEDKSQAEIAYILGCSVKAVETRIYRARQKLRKELSELLSLE